MEQSKRKLGVIFYSIRTKQTSCRCESILKLCLPGTPLSSLNTLSPHRIPLTSPLTFLSPPLLPSQALFSEPILSLLNLSVNLRKKLTCIYDIYMVLMVLSHTHLMVCYLPTYIHTYSSKITLFIVQSISRAAFSHCPGKRWTVRVYFSASPAQRWPDEMSANLTKQML